MQNSDYQSLGKMRKQKSGGRYQSTAKQSQFSSSTAQEED